MATIERMETMALRPLELDISNNSEKAQETAGRSMGRVAIVGSFESLDPRVGEIYGARAARDLYARGIIGHDQLVGIQPIVDNQEDLEEVLATTAGLNSGIESRNQGKDPANPSYYNSVLSGYDPKPFQVNLYNADEDDIINRHLVDSAMRQAWIDFDAYIEGGKFSSVPVHQRSLIFTTLPRVAAKIADNITEECLRFGGSITEYRTQSYVGTKAYPMARWLTFERPRNDLGSYAETASAL